MHSIWPGRRNQLYLQGGFVGKGFRQGVMLELSLKGGTFQVKMVGKEIQVEYEVRKRMRQVKVVCTAVLVRSEGRWGCS